MAQELARASLGTVEHLARRNEIERERRGARVAGPGVLQITTIGEAMDLAQQIAGTSFVPKDLRGKPAEVLACILHGSELGIGPMQALSGVAMINGRPFLTAQLTQSLLRRAGHAFRVMEATPEQATVAIVRAGETSQATVTVTMAEAKQAGWTRNPVYAADPAAMLVARATSRAARWHAAEVLGGLPLEQEADTWDQWEAPVSAPALAPGASLIDAALERAAAELGIASDPPPEASPPAEQPPAEEPEQAEEVSSLLLDVDLPGDTDGWSELGATHGIRLVNLVHQWGAAGIKKWSDLPGLDVETRGQVFLWITSHELVAR